MDNKFCRTCGDELTIENRCASRKDCKKCRAEYQRLYRKSHADELKKKRVLNKESANKRHREYYVNNKESVLIKSRERYYKNRDYNIHRNLRYQKDNRELVNERRRARTRELKTKFLEMYGDRCSCCGESAFEFLTIEHVQGQVGRKRKEIGEYAYKNAIKVYDPDTYDVLCWNCNCSKGKYGYCPHQMKSHN